MNPPHPPAARPRVTVLAVLAAVLVAVLAVFIAPRPAAPGPHTAGDTDLAERVREGIGDGTGYLGLSVALVEPGPDGDLRVRAAALGTQGQGEPIDPRTRFGSASVAKVLPGMLLADMVDRGEVALDTPVGGLLPDLDFTDPEVGGVTLVELATHTSGLSREETTLLQTFWQFAAKRHPAPYGSVDDFLRTVAEEVRVDPELRGTNSYSNTGVDLLGHALAARADTTYADLVRTRLLDPLGMDDSAVWTAADGPAHLVHDADRGRPIALDRAEANGPSGGLVTTAPDLGLLVAAMMEGTAPGADSARAAWPGDVERREQGLGWYVETLDGRAVTGHGGNATTNGHTAWIGHTGDRGAVVLSNTHRFSEDVGLRLLGIGEPSPDNATGERVYAIATAVLALAPGVLALGFAARRRPGRWWRRPADRLGLVSHGLAGAAVLWYVHLAGFWHLVSPWTWVAGVALSCAAAAVGARRWAGLPTARGHRPWARWLRVLPPVAASCAVLVVLALL